MNPTQAAVRASIFSSPVKPRVIGVSTFSNPGTPITLTIPRSPGKLCIGLIGADNGTPGLPTGFTNLASVASVSGTSWGGRLCHKFLDGSEAATLTSASTSATNMCAVLLLIDGAVSTRVPQAVAFSSANTAAPDPAAVTVTSPVTQCLGISVLIHGIGSGQTITSLPTGFTQAKFASATSGTLISTLAWQENFCVSSFNPGAYALSASATCTISTAVVRTI